MKLKSGLFVLLFALTVNAEIISKISPEWEQTQAYEQVHIKMQARLLHPFYFNVPYVSFAPLPEALINSRSAMSPTAPVLIHYRENSWKSQRENPDSVIGLRLIVVDGNASRMTNSRELGESGLFEPGDIVLSFRPEWYGTLKYSHIQLGVSHAGLLYHEKGRDGRTYLKNLDMPLDPQHVGEGFLNSDHYIGAPYLHVIRARNLTPKQKDNINHWIKLLAKNGPRAYKNKKLRFNTNYGAPKYRPEGNLKFVADLGRIALGIDNDSMLTNYCSEFVWSVLSLRDCDPNDKRQFKQNSVPACVKEIFEPMPVLGTLTTANEESRRNDWHTVGLADGMPLIMQIFSSRIEDPLKRNQLADHLISWAGFRDANDKAENISSGHRSVEAAILSANPQFYDYLLRYFLLSNDEGAAENPVVLALRENFNAAQPRNYSPTSFMIHAILPNDTAIKAMDYIGTIYYARKLTGSSVYETLRSLKVEP